MTVVSQLKFDSWYYITLADGRDAIVPASSLAEYDRNPIKSIKECQDPQPQKLTDGWRASR